MRTRKDQIAELAALLAMIVQSNSGAPPRVVRIAHKIIELANEEAVPMMTLQEAEERYFGRIRRAQQ